MLLVFLALLVLPVVAATLCLVALGLPSNRPFALAALARVLYAVALGLFGTALPAGIDRDPRYSMSKAMRLLPRTLGLPAAGPCLFALLAGGSVGIGAGLVTAFAKTAPTTAEPVIDFTISTLATFPGVVNSALTAAVPCQVDPAPLRFPPATVNHHPHRLTKRSAPNPRLALLLVSNILKG